MLTSVYTVDDSRFLAYCGYDHGLKPERVKGYIWDWDRVNEVFLGHIILPFLLSERLNAVIMQMNKTDLL